MNNTKRSLAAVLLLGVSLVAGLVSGGGVLAEESVLRLGNDAWPPFVIAGPEAGTAEALVCEALRRGGVGCEVEIDGWEAVLADAEAGRLDGIAAIWRTAERERTLLFSDAYMTNRVVPVSRGTAAVEITRVEDLAGKRVAMASSYAYGDEIDRLRPTFEVVPVTDAAAALRTVLDGRADVALADELVVQDLVRADQTQGLVGGRTVLSQRQLYFAISRTHPRAQEIITSFNHHYGLMVLDGTVNDILDVDWLATDIGGDGVMDFVLRDDASVDDLAYAADNRMMYALGDRDHAEMQRFELGKSSASYRVAGTEYESIDDAVKKAFDSERCIINCRRDLKLR